MATRPGRGGRPLRLATRGSPLARWQADRVAGLLRSRPGGRAEGETWEIVVIETMGDRLTEVPIDRLGGQGAFAGEVQRAVLEGRADIGVH